MMLFGALLVGAFYFIGGEPMLIGGIIGIFIGEVLTIIVRNS